MNLYFAFSQNTSFKHANKEHFLQEFLIEKFECRIYALNYFHQPVKSNKANRQIKAIQCANLVSKFLSKITFLFVQTLSLKRPKIVNRLFDTQKHTVQMLNHTNDIFHWLINGLELASCHRKGVAAGMHFYGGVYNYIIQIWFPRKIVCGSLVTVSSLRNSGINIRQNIPCIVALYGTVPASTTIITENIYKEKIQGKPGR